LPHERSDYAFAHDVAKSAGGKWRPKGGSYAASGADVRYQCAESGIIVELGKKKIIGDEWSCKITKLTDIAPGAIRLDMICNDYNLAEFIKDPNPEREFREIMLLRKIDEKSMFVRKTQNGKFKDPDWRASYCSEEDQRLHAEAKARDRAEAEPKAAAERTMLNPWRPRDGIYATPGTNFEDRCLKASDATIEFFERSISSCSVTFIRDEQNAIKLFASCSQEPNPQGSIGRVALPSSETILLKKIDDNSISMQKSKNGSFIDPGAQLSYCGQDVQRMHAQQKAKK
jgi:hypothetical protein